jgi:SAM-dependent methyltransferase
MGYEYTRANTTKSKTERMSQPPIHETADSVQPFDWLTSAVSLQQLLRSTVAKLEVEDSSDLGNPGSNLQVLHVGCGSSLLGELIVEDPTYNVSLVVNVDCDSVTLQRMQDRWERRCARIRHGAGLDAMQFVVADFTEVDALSKLEFGYFDMIVDKSTLDCMLCTGTGAAGLLAEVYRLLKHGGVYLVITFHHFDFVRPLLEQLPGAEWDVTCTTMSRQVEDLTELGRTGVRQCDANIQGTESARNQLSDGEQECKASRTWATGTFQPDETYRKTVNVLHCRKRCRGELEWDKVLEHIQKVNNQWYVHDNPLLTTERAHAIRSAFKDDNLDLATCYNLLFTEAEPEHLEFDDFVGDWETFLQQRPYLVSNEGFMSSDHAIEFLEAMQ